MRLSPGLLPDSERLECRLERGRNEDGEAEKDVNSPGEK